MRKSFTLLFSTLMLLCVFGFSSFAAVPQLSSTKPADGADNVKPSTTHLVVKFNQNVKFTSTGGTLTIWKGATPVKTVALVSGNADAVIAADSLKVKHNLTLTDGTAYAVTITNNAIENAAGEKFGGIAAGAWDFTTGDYTAPVVEKLTPLDGAANVDVKATPFNLVIEFKDALSNIEAVPGKKVWVYEADGTIVDIIVIDGTNTSVTGKIATVTVNTNAFVNELTEYYVNVEAGAFTDTSPNKNKFAGIMNKTTWNFSSRDYSAAYLTAATVTNVSYATATLNATANEAGLIWYKRQLATDAAPTGTATEAGGWTKVTTGTGNSITAALSGMTDGTKYAVYVVAENALAQQQTVATKIEFTTLDNTAPLASDKVLVNESNVTVGVGLTFNEAVVPGTGNLLIKRQSNNETVRTVPASELLIVAGTGANLGKWFMTARFEGLESGVGYYVVIPSGYVEDAAGNDYVSTYVTATAWQFTASDFVAPTVEVKIAASTPPASADNIVIDFSEEVRLMNGVAMSTLVTDADWFNYIALEKANVPVPFTASYAGSVITVNPVSDLAPNSTYVVKIRKNVFEDLNDNPFSNEHKTYELVTGDFGPATIAYAPLNNATAVAKGTQPKITFSKVAKIKGTTPADITATNLKPILVFKKDNASGANVAFTVSWDAATRTATLVPDAELASEGVYYVDIDHTKVEDVYGGAFADPGTSLFTMIDYIVPTVTFSHTGTVTNKAAADPLMLTFSEDVTLLFDVADLVVFKQDNASGANLAFSAAWDAATDKITITPSAPLEKGKVYYYGVGAGVASDGVNKNAAALTTFTFEPAVPDQVEVAENGLVPAHEATGVKVNAAGDLVATITFTEAVKANPIMPTPSNAILYDSNDVAVKTVAILAGYFEGSKLTVTFEDVILTSEGEYYITIDEDVVVANANNNKTFAGILAGDWTFTAADIVKPVLTANTPASGATGVALNAPVIIGVVPAEDVVTGTGNITIVGATDSKTVAVTNVVIDNEAGTITVPHAAFSLYGTVYTVTVPAGAFKDNGGNANDAFTWSFTTVANPAPTVVSLDPADGEDMVAAGTENFVIEFSEEVQKGASGTVAFLFEKGTGANRAVLAGSGIATPNDDIQRGAVLVTSSNVQVTGNVVTINFDGFKLVDGKEYFILIEPGMFKDKSAPTTADFAGIPSYVEGDGGWNFYTKDVIAPTWEVTYVERGEGMDITSDIVITFSKPIEKTGGTEITNADVATLFTLALEGTPNTPIAFTGNISADKTVVVLENASFLPALSTAMSGGVLLVAPTTGIRGKVNQKAVSTTAEEINISDYVAPTVTLTAGAVEGEEFEFNVSSNEAGTIYWLVVKGAATTKTAADVMVGTAIEDYESGIETITVDEDIESETEYTVYAVAVDETGNVSTVKTVTVETDDITKPLLVAKTSTFTNAGVLQLDFNEEVVPGTATAVIRLAGTLEIVDIVPLTATAELDSLILTSAVALTYADDQKFVIEIAGGIGKVADAAGNFWNGQIGLGENAWVVGLNDRTKPTLVSIKPALPTTDPKAVIPVDSNIELTFSENVKKADNAQFILYHWDGELVVYEVLTGSTVAISGKVITINPTRNLVSGQRYQLTITDGSILDMTGNVLDGSIVRQFDAADNVAPTATFLPANDATAVPVGVTPTITFTEALVLADGTAIDNFDLETMVYLKKDGAAVAHTAMIDAAKKIITIDPTADLTQGAVYTYGFTAGFTDAAKNAVAAKEAKFTVATDAMIAAYIEFDPDNKDALNATVVPVDQAFRIIFSGQLYTYSDVNSQNNIAVTPSYLQGATAGAGAITLKQGAANVPFTASIESWTADETVIVITPNAVLGSEKEYDLTVVGNKLQLGVGNQTILTLGESNDYLTEDALAPTAVTLVPADGTAASASGTLSISFSEKVMAGTGAIQIKHEHGEVVLTIDAADLVIENNLVKITALSELEEGEEYFVIIPSGVITDLSGNAFAGITGEDDWNFIISETLGAPQIVNIAPVGGNAPINSSLVITFDRPVKLSATEGFIAIYNANGVAVQLIRFNDANVGTLISFNADRTVATVDINDLAQNTKYEVEVAAGMFVLNADATLKNEGVKRTIWTFTTEVNEPPVLLIRTPADNATNVSLRTVAKMGFNMDVKAGTGAITLRRGVDGTVVHSFDVTSSEVEFNGKTVSFDISSYLEADATAYYIIVPAGAITNTSTTPEAFAGLEQTTSWNFTTQADGEKPELVTWSPNDVEIENNKPTFVLEFNEDVKVVSPVKLVVTKVGQTTPALEIPVTASMVDGSTITITYEERISGVLEYSAEYFVTIEGGAIEDLWENVWEAGVTDPTAWTFKTKDVNTAVAQIQGTGTSSPMLNQVVHVTGTITGISAGEGFFVQDDNAAWSGIWVSYGTTASLNIGDGVRVFGTVAEVAEVTTINASSVEMVDAPVVVAPVVVASPSAAKAEMYESVLVQVGGARANAANANGVWTIYYEVTNTVAVNKWFYTYTPVAGTYYNVAGIVNGRYSDYKLEPRMASDITDLTDTNAPVVPVVDFKVYPNPFNDRISIVNHDKLTRVVITNIAGQRVMDVQFPESEIRTANLVSGVYVISLFTEDGMVKSDRIVKR
jgi:methionine-rich copper-binding protein CopC